MKKFRFLLLSLAIIAGVSVARAEQGDNAVGFNLNYAVGSGDISNFGIGVKYSHQMSDNLRVQPSFTYYFEKDGINMKDISADFHYLFNVSSDDKMFFYPIFGLTSVFYSFDAPEVEGVKIDDHTWTRLGCNLGAGLQYNITDDFGIVGEAKYKILKDIDQFTIAIGCVVTF